MGISSQHNGLVEWKLYTAPGSGPFHFNPPRIYAELAANCKTNLKMLSSLLSSHPFFQQTLLSLYYVRGCTHYRLSLQTLKTSPLGSKYLINQTVKWTGNSEQGHGALRGVSTREKNLAPRFFRDPGKPHLTVIWEQTSYSSQVSLAWSVKNGKILVDFISNLPQQQPNVFGFQPHR